MKKVVWDGEKPNNQPPVKDLPEGTIFVLHSDHNSVYQKVNGYKWKTDSVCAIRLGGTNYICDGSGDRFSDSTDYTIVTEVPTSIN